MGLTPPPEARAAPLDISPALAAWIGGEREARLIVGRGGEVFWTSAVARRLLEAGHPFRIAEGRLVASREALRAALLQALQCATEQPRCWLMEHGATWVVWSQRIAGEEASCIGLTLRGAAQSIEFAALAEAGGLTRKEARVVALMLSGANPAAIANKLEISIETLRTHVKHAYRKLGVTSRGELFACAMAFLQP